MDPTCSHPDCSNTVLARDLCRSHYYRARGSGELPQRPTQKDCGHCGQPFAVGSFGRLPLFCSERCKDAASGKRRRARGKPPGPDDCEQCGTSLAGRRRDTRFCTPKCSNDWRNAQIAARTRAEKLARRQPCVGCRGPIPEDRNGQARYCSKACIIRSRRHAAYGLTKQELDALLDQHEVCKICGTDDWGPRGPQVDHCHESSIVRGVLCTSCNNGLGRFRDRPDLLRAAADYLERALTSP